MKSQYNQEYVELELNIEKKTAKKCQASRDFDCTYILFSVKFYLEKLLLSNFQGKNGNTSYFTINTLVGNHKVSSVNQHL